MKKHNVNNKLAFNKAAVAELNSAELTNVNGGSVTIGVAVAVVVATIKVMEYIQEQQNK